MEKKTIFVIHTYFDYDTNIEVFTNYDLACEYFKYKVEEMLNYYETGKDNKKQEFFQDYFDD